MLVENTKLGFLAKCGKMLFTNGIHAKLPLQARNETVNFLIANSNTENFKTIAIILKFILIL